MRSRHFLSTAAVAPAITLTAAFGPAFVPTSSYSRRSITDMQIVPLKSTTNSDTVLPKTSPLPPHTFAGMVEAGIKERFGEKAAARVIESWRLMEADYYHTEYLGSDANPDDADPLRQECHSYVPGLSAIPFWNTDEHPWCQKLASKYKAIKKEFKAATADMERLEREGNNIWAGALTEDASSYGEGWKTLVLMDRGRWDPVNVNLFPVTAKTVHDSGVPAVEVFLASMKPHTSIKLHTDFTNFVLTSHLALEIPYSGTNQCRLTVGDQTREWINGQVMLFDTSILHDAVNDSDGTRYILMLRLWHPDLTEAERQALQFTYDCLEAPEIVTSSDPQQRFAAEKQMEMMRAFPEIKKGTGRSQGFGGGGDSKKSKKKPKKGSNSRRGFGT